MATPLVVKRTGARQADGRAAAGAGQSTCFGGVNAGSWRSGLINKQNGLEIYFHGKHIAPTGIKFPS